VEGTLQSEPDTQPRDRDTQQADKEGGDQPPAEDHTLLTTEATGVIANVGLGRAAIGVRASAASDGAAIGGRRMAIGISTIILWTVHRMSFLMSNMPIRP
jgi:hypothetical protein